MIRALSLVLAAGALACAHAPGEAAAPARRDASCVVDLDCDAHEYCDVDRCVAKRWPCGSSRDCDEGELCVNRECVRDRRWR